jgi:hypothetical protein
VRERERHELVADRARGEHVCRDPHRPAVEASKQRAHAPHNHSRSPTVAKRIFGGRSAGELYDWIFVAHQVGAALGAWTGGVVFQTFGSYTFAYESAAALAFLAAIMAFTIKDEARYSRRSEQALIAAGTA